MDYVMIFGLLNFGSENETQFIEIYGLRKIGEVSDDHPVMHVKPWGVSYMVIYIELVCMGVKLGAKTFVCLISQNWL